MPILTRAAHFLATSCMALGLSMAAGHAQDQGGAATGETAAPAAQATPAPNPGAEPNPGREKTAPAPASSSDPTADLSAAGEWQTSMSLAEATKYPADFQHYDYVNPDAPKGGTLNSVVVGSYDSFNPFVVRGTPAAGLANFGGGLLYDTLMEQSTDEPSVTHAMIAEAVRFPKDDSFVTFRLDPEAKWHDGEPITVEDVIWSFDTLKELHPQWATYYKNVVKAEKTGEREVTFTFDQTGNRELPHIMGDLTVLPKHWWEGTGPDGKPRDISQPSLEPPLGSGPYEIGPFVTGQSIEWERVKDYWGADVATHKGRYNYDKLDYTYIRDANAAWEAFKKGGLDDYRIENSSRRWAQEYNFPAFEKGEVKKTTIPDNQVESMQAYVLNNRLAKFQDRRVREALTLAYNFEDMNKSLFFSLYERMGSYFDNSELASSGLPSERELKFLEPLKDQIPPEVFTEEFSLPVYTDNRSTREHLRQALELFREAGYELQGTRLVDPKTGRQFSIEMLGDDPTDARVLQPYADSLKRLGIDATIRIVDSNQYIERLTNFDFEMTSLKYYPQSMSPGNEQRDFWSSGAADTPGSRNYAGIKNPAIDALVNDIVYAKDRDELVAATRALDRVMLWEYYVVPQWFKNETWLAYWDKFGMPDKSPGYSSIDPFAWWIKSAEEAAAN
ncbi:extracellular solute-binding protein [Jiella avicenniae]|uniref:Extracellular solute-binding protein n=1 Tax=Jiella avicenniae TaxID=2907202 RepID=A0A9X1P490_9HYPH|nr:extracellular solute-binding protein [Jiella avicenniae]MCE7030737.1 extracellular solute-binding protein [Jiella avicenniae]